MNAGHEKMTLQTALVISGAVALAFLILLWALTGFGFWGALFIGLLIGIAAFIFLLVFYTDDALSGGDGQKTAPRQVEEARAPTAAAGSDRKAAESMARPAGGAAGASGASVADTASPGPDATDDATKPGSGAAAGATGEMAHPGAAGASEAQAQPDSDVAPVDTGEKPATLAGAREGGPDDLKKIKGVGPKLEKTLNEMGYYHFDQIAAWSSAEVAWVDENLQGFKGRVSRDNWVEQARILASGGETEFSRKAGKGGST